MEKFSEKTFFQDSCLYVYIYIYLKEIQHGKKEILFFLKKNYLFFLTQFSDFFNKKKEKDFGNKFSKKKFMWLKHFFFKRFFYLFIVF